MAPCSIDLYSRNFKPGKTDSAFSDQWKNPGDVFSVLLLLGGDIVACALAQLLGTRLTPVAFSFGWVTFAVSAVKSAFGENKLMPPPDCPCMVINGKTGYVRENNSWILGRMVRDFEYWMDDGQPCRPVRTRLDQMIKQRRDLDKKAAQKDLKKSQSPSTHATNVFKTGLCVSVYRAGQARPGYPSYDVVYWTGCGTSIVQLGIATVPGALFGRWDTLLITVAEILFAFASGSFAQWRQEKWVGRQSDKTNVILTNGNGSQHAIIMLAGKGGLDLEDLASGRNAIETFASRWTRDLVVLLGTLWVILLITAAGIKEHTLYLLIVGAVGMVQNIFTAGRRRSPQTYGVPLTFIEVIGEIKVMGTLFAVEKQYSRMGRSMREIYFLGPLRPHEEKRWNDLKDFADTLDQTQQQGQHDMYGTIAGRL